MPIGNMGSRFYNQPSKHLLWSTIGDLAPYCDVLAVVSDINLHLPFHAGQREETHSRAHRPFELSNPSSSFA